MENEFRKSKDGLLFLGLVPKISVDPRILCPRDFTGEFPPPPPPTVRYYEIATKAAAKAAAAMWEYRQYIEVIKIGYKLANASPDHLYITAEAVLVMPVSGEKIPVRADQWISSVYSDQGMGLEFANEAEYERVCDNLAGLLTQQTKWAVEAREADLSRDIDSLKLFQSVFGVNAA